jgi:hypothetical protein
MQDQATAVEQTAACETARHGLCKGVVFSITDAHLSPCGVAASIEIWRAWADRLREWAEE